METSGNHQHHIVEQSQIDKSAFEPQQIHNTNNIVEVTPQQHYDITGHYNSIQDYTNGLRVRDWLAGKSFEFQYEYGIDIMNKLGITP